MARVITMLAAVVVVVLASGAPLASALDLTGTWEGKQTCKGLADGDKDTFTCCDTIGITQIADVVNIRVEQTEDVYFGRVTTLNGHPDKGAVTYVSCNTDNSLPSSSEMVFADVSDDPKAGSVKGSFKGSGPFLDSQNEQYVCTWSYKRVNRTDPLVLPCSSSP